MLAKGPRKDGGTKASSLSARDSREALLKVPSSCNQQDDSTEHSVRGAPQRRRREGAARRVPENARLADRVRHRVNRFVAVREPAGESMEAVQDVRTISIDTVVPGARSALFTRGQKKASVAVTLGTANEVQRLDSIDEAESKRSRKLHYNFQFLHRRGSPDARHRSREIDTESRERAHRAVPRSRNSRTLCIVSDILESNGSSSRLGCGGSCAVRRRGSHSRRWCRGSDGLIKEGEKYHPHACSHEATLETGTSRSPETEKPDVIQMTSRSRASRKNHG